MKTYIALFRGINVGGKNTLPMKELVSVFDNQKLENIRTYIQSGNVVFDSPEKPAADFGVLIEKQYGFKPTVIILTSSALEEAARNNPYFPEEGKLCHFFFCSKSIEKIDTTELSALKAASEKYKIVGKVLYLHAPDGIGRSKLAANMENLLKVPVTARNLNTVNKLLEMIK